MFVIEDSLHAEPFPEEFENYDDALREVRRIASVTWMQEPNIPPCMAGKDCARVYHIIQYDNSGTPWNVLHNWKICEVSAKGVNWEK